MTIEESLHHKRAKFAGRTPALLCFGEISWDLRVLLPRLPKDSTSLTSLFRQENHPVPLPVPVHEGPGGCALNTAFALRVLGAPVTLSGNLLGDDDFGARIKHATRALGIRDEILQRAGISTALCYCVVEENTGERDFVLEHEFIQTTDENLVPQIAHEIRAGAYEYVFVQPYIREMSRRLLHEIQETSTWILTQDLAADSEFVELCDAIQISLEDHQEFHEDMISSLAKPYFRGRSQELFITAGARGVGYVRKGERARLFPGERAEKVIDTTGCGDAFRAGLMWGRANGLVIDEAIALGQLVGAYKAGVEGSCLSILDEKERLVGESGNEIQSAHRWRGF